MKIEKYYKVYTYNYTNIHLKATLDGIFVSCAIYDTQVDMNLNLPFL